TSVLYNPTAMVFLVWGLSLLVIFGNNRREMITVTNTFYIKSINTGFIIMSFLITVVFYLKTQTLIDFKTITEGENQRFYYKISDTKMLLIEDDSFVEFKFGFEKFHEGEVKNGISMMENSIKKSPIPDANIVLANLYSEQKNFVKTEQLLLLNIGIEPFRFEPKENLFRFYIQTNQKEKSIKTAQEIINLPVKIRSNKVDVYKSEAEKYLKNNH
ncbi:MAG: hypothetical protein ABI793_16070, partial [Flavobacterium sp.]